jgi:ATP-dependent Clp protease ATP-binding subunit ClpC
VENLGYQLILTEEAKKFIASKGYDVQFGARPLKRAIQKYLEDEMAEIIIKATVTEGDAIIVDFDKEEHKIVTSIDKGKAVLPKRKKAIAEKPESKPEESGSANGDAS